MKRLALVAVLLVFAIGESPHAVNAAPADCSQVLTPMAFETITVGASAVGFTASVITPSGGSPAQYAVVSVEEESLRYRDDGVNPTDSVGHLLTAGQSLTVCGVTTLQRIRFIEVAEAQEATIQVSYYKAGN